MSDKKQTWKLVTKKGDTVVNPEPDLDTIRVESLKLIEAKEDHNYLIQYFEDYKLIDEDELSVYF